MSRVVVFEHLTLDGVMQAPGRPDEDDRDGFEHGGWATLWDPVIGSRAEESMGATEGLLLGRRTYQMACSGDPLRSGTPCAYWKLKGAGGGPHEDRRWPGYSPGSD